MLPSLPNTATPSTTVYYEKVSNVLAWKDVQTEDCFLKCSKTELARLVRSVFSTTHSIFLRFLLLQLHRRRATIWHPRGTKCDTSTYIILCWNVKDKTGRQSPTMSHRRGEILSMVLCQKDVFWELQLRVHINVSQQTKQTKERERKQQNKRVSVFRAWEDDYCTLFLYYFFMAPCRMLRAGLAVFLRFYYGRQWCCFFFFFEKGMAVAWRGMFWGFACCAFGKLGGDVYPSTIPISPCFVSKGKILLWAYYYCITPTYILRSIHFVYCVLVQHLLTAHLTAVR